MSGWNIDEDAVHTYADGLSKAAMAAKDTWDEASSAINKDTGAINGPDKLSSAFYSGYSRRRDRLKPLGKSLPERFEGLARIAHDSADDYFTAELIATGGFLG